jgi:alpha-1,3-fucosyltransferase
MYKKKSSKFSRKFLFLITILCIGSIFALNFFISENVKFQDSGAVKDENIDYDYSQFDNQKVVLFYTKFFGSRFWGEDKEVYNESDFINLGCEVTNCVFTHDRNFFEYETDYDALVFHGGEFKYAETKPTERAPHQLYIFACKENPAHIPYALKIDHKQYNLTMTYRLDSDIFWPYGRVNVSNSDENVAPNSNIIWKTPDETVVLGKFSDYSL